jgi:hypothetical protein
MMKIGIVECGGELADVFLNEVSAKVATVDFQKKRALDLFDALAFAKKFAALDHVVIIARLDPDEHEQNAAFYEGLAVLEAETGKNIFKCLYRDEDEGGALVKELAETFVNYLFYPDKLKKPPAAEESFGI